MHYIRHFRVYFVIIVIEVFESFMNRKVVRMCDGWLVGWLVGWFVIHVKDQLAITGRFRIICFPQSDRFQQF
jgi:hypothetical protein